MKRLRLKNPFNYDSHLDYVHDVKRIIKVYEDRGFKISFDDALLSWERFSEGYCAEWMLLPTSDEKLFLNTRCFFEDPS